jgi:nucleotide-binding universal stress UspA family protein
MHRNEPIVVAVDFTDGSRAPLSEAIRIARWNSAPIKVVHVVDIVVARALEDALSELQRDIRAGLLRDAQSGWTAFAATVPGAADLPIEVRIGRPSDCIVQAARDAKAGLLVVGANAGSDLNVGMGTVATASVRNAPCDALIVRGRQNGPFRSVVACVDFSKTSLRAVEEAARIATQDDAKLHVVHVCDAPWRHTHYRAPTPEADPRVQRQYLELLERRLRSFAGEHGSDLAYLAPTYAIAEGSSHRGGIVDYAVSVGADLVVLGRRGATNLRDLLLGSTAEKTLRQSVCSVLAVKPRPEDLADDAD